MARCHDKAAGEVQDELLGETDKMTILLARERAERAKVEEH